MLKIIIHQSTKGLAARLCASVLISQIILTTVLFPLTSLADADVPASTHKKVSFDTALATIDADIIDIYPHYTSRAYGPHWAGAISVYKERIYVMNAAGEFMQVAPDIGVITKLDWHYENNRSNFLAYALPKISRLWPHNFRFYDFIVSERQTRPIVLASTLYWHTDKACYTLRVIQLDIDQHVSSSTARKETADWHVIFETKPCLRLDEPLTQFIGQEGGGKMAISGDNLLLTVGHFGYYGLKGGEPLSQQSNNDYGKIFRISLVDHSAGIVSIGHRNPQGITITKGGDIWSTEHGPQGGDELNLIKDGENYGWPLETLGADYGEMTWLLSKEQGRHSRFRKPIYAWLPSIGVSAVDEIDNFLAEWNGDLLVASLRANTLYRLRLSNQTVMYSEPIKLNERIRDLDQLPDGTILVFTDTSRLFMIRPSLGTEEVPSFDFVQDAGVRQAARDAVDNCGVCHSFAEGRASANAPNLWGVYGRGIAKGDFEGYSESMRDKEGVWNEQTLGELLTNAASFASESPMASVPPIADDRVRSAVIAYLKRLN